MKPIELTISGLHSFREKQTIDFEGLCDGGVFGIFGPTGSGKSSILDAITLALYGKVERAANNTHGILNHAEDQLSVSYTFELQNGTSVKRYKVERTYKRTDEHRVKGSISRLVDLQAEPVVLADKASEVNEKVHELLGLTIDDFTRAVVLPQGKFAEFLSLKGSERRQMLQRLFHLEQYGDELLKKLRGRLSNAKYRLGETEAEQAGLGDASKAALKAAETEWQSSSILLEKRLAERKTVRDAYDEQKKVWELQQERKQLEEKEAKLEQQTEEMESIENRLKTADQAERLKPYADQLESSEKRHAVLLDEEKKWSAEWEKQKQSTAEAKQAFEEARKQKEMNEPVLAVKKERLTQLLEVEKERDLRIIETEKLIKELERLEHAGQKAKQEFDHAGQQLEKAKAKQQQLKLELEKLAVSPVYRRSIQAASDLQKEWKYAEEQKKEAEQFHSQLLQQQKSLEKDMQDRRGKRELESEKLVFVYSGLLRTFERTSELKSRLEKSIARSKERAADAKVMLEKERVHSIARQLSASLQEGEACPVCGSTSHPMPVHGELEEGSRVQLEQLEKELEHNRVLLQEAELLRVKMEELSTYLIGEFSWIAEGSVHSESAAALEPAEEDSLTEMKALKQDLLHIREKASASVKMIQQLKNEEQQSVQFMERCKLDLQDALAKLQQLNEKDQAFKRQWAEAYPDMKQEDVQDRMKEIDEKDTQFEALQTRVNKSVEYIEEQEKLRQAAQEKLAELDRLQIQTKEKKQASQERLDEKERVLEKENQNGTIPAQLEGIEKQLSQLAAREKQHRSRYDEMDKHLQEAEKELAAAGKGLINAAKSVEEARNSWQRQLKQTALRTIGEVHSSLLNQQEKESIASRLEAFRDNWKQCKADLKRLNEQLLDRKLDEETWQKTKELISECEALVSEAEGLKGAAAKALELLKEKHERFEKLEEQRLDLSGKIADLEKLQAVFKGNSFVEYIAEEQLHHVTRAASERLGLLTRQRYAIEVDSQGGFIMRDDANGGVRRPVSSLSGGETFLTSLALALSLSTQIQLRGEYPLQFFFLDEGFGTLDADLLDTVVTALEKLQSNNLSVGVISHVPELRARLSKKLVVTPADPAGRGTAVALETL
ncbi:SMC family ATPase [Metabacillus sp. KIGAM252]|uniref:Nuclease SbcCD subunit C n=1 Tax=Metabacillus flavus TaxID=2823519 RepID=A0ABS5LCN9_9BACI|nr:SMC family ATPase [Metabacillus flavus]MBS2968298.1 SMC family ATPase [Metabacillus flavus]